MTVRDREAVNARARTVAEDPDRNGIRLVLVEIQGDAAKLDVYFLNTNRLSQVVADFAGGTAAPEIFDIAGGHRRLAGVGEGQVRVVSIEAPVPAEPRLRLTVEPIGDYSTYTLSIDTTRYPEFDPFFSEVDFKFRPGCFNNCPPDWEPAPAPVADPPIDYLAKDYESFRHTLIAWMIDRVPGWQPTSEADLDQVLLELFGVAADELSDFQDRVLNEAYLLTARKRVSLARHARLMDYHVHQGSQASTWLALDVRAGAVLDVPPRFRVATGDALDEPDAVVFMTRERREVRGLLSRMRLYTWSGAVPTLDAGTRQAELKLDVAGQAAAETVRDLIRGGGVTRLLVQEHLNPATGRPAGRDPEKRQLVRLLAGERGADAAKDPVTDEWYVRVRWREEDRLRRRYCFLVDCPDGPVDDVSLFHGNLVRVHEGRPARANFKPEGEALALQVNPDDPIERHYERDEDAGVVVCRLPAGPLAYRNTPVGGDRPPRSTLEVVVEQGGVDDPWEERPSLVHSDGSAERGDHFVVETDEDRGSVIRFGDGVNGRRLPDDAVVRCFYQAGGGVAGNVGRDALRAFDEGAFPDVVACWNPFDVTDGRDPEPAAEIIRRVPEAYRSRQLRAVTPRDYVDRAEERPGVSRAAARYTWTGSWRAVRVTIDPVGTTELSDALAAEVARHLDAVRTIGDDLEIRGPRLVPLEIHLSVCIHPDHWPEDVRFFLEQEFSDGYTPDGRMAFFHPDRWTFGQGLRVSQLTGRAQRVPGVDHVIEVRMKRWNEATPGEPGRIEVRDNEIIEVRNDPDHMERGFIELELEGERR